ncbi:MAG: putative chromate transport protein half length [Pseudomonadota bacterium]
MLPGTDELPLRVIYSLPRPASAAADNLSVTETNAPLAQPRSLGDLFLSFTLLALQGFGGVLAVAQRELVERKRWMTREEFVEEWAVAQIMPGPNVVNLSLMIGSRYFGWRGAMAALAGMLLAPLAVVLVLALLYTQYGQLPQVAGALRGMGAVAAGLVAATGLKLLSTLSRHPLGLAGASALAVGTFIAVGLLGLPLAVALLGLGGLGWGLTWHKLGTTSEAPRA